MLSLILCRILHVSNTLKEYSVFVVVVAVVANVALVNDVAALFDHNMSFVADITHRDDILETLPELETKLEVENWEFRE